MKKYKYSIIAQPTRNWRVFMEKLSQEYFMRLSFSNAIEKEEQLLKKYDYYYNLIQDKELKESINEFIKTSREHIELLKSKRLLINYDK